MASLHGKTASADALSAALRLVDDLDEQGLLTLHREVSRRAALIYRAKTIDRWEAGRAASVPR